MRSEADLVVGRQNEQQWTVKYETAQTIREGRAGRLPAMTRYFPSSHCVKEGFTVLLLTRPSDVWVWE